MDNGLCQRCGAWHGREPVRLGLLSEGRPALLAVLCRRCADEVREALRLALKPVGPMARRLQEL